MIMKYLFYCCLIVLFVSCKNEGKQLPNIILVMTDDQGYGDYSCHGNPLLQTPHLDRFSTSAVNLTNFHVATTCSPTRAGLLTGMHCNRTGTWHMVMTDDQGYGDYSCHGNPLLQTPHLDRFSTSAVNFTNFHVATTCSPTRAGLLTGMHCNRTGTWHTVNGRSFLSTRFPTIASYLKEIGYHTSIFGKWHLGDNYPFRPQDRGFDEVLVHGGGGIGQGPDFWGNDYFDDTYLHNGEDKQFNGYCADVWFGEAIKHITKQSSSGEPFFCYISSNTAHGPHYAPQQFIDPFLNNEDVVNAGFMGQVANIDENMGKLMDAINQRGLKENTIVILTRIKRKYDCYIYK